MRISKIETYLVGNPWKNWLFVKVSTDEGIYGLGEGSLGRLSKTVEAAIHEMKPLILGLEVFQTELLVERLSRHVYADGGQIKMCAISALEIACWDAIGKAVGQPVYNLVGGRCHDRVRAYANGWYTTDRTPEAFAAAAIKVLQRGYGAMKFDPFGAAMGILSQREEALSVEIVAAVREAVGPDVDLAIECHSRFSVSTAVRIGKKIEQYEPAWFEEPVPHGNIPAIIEVARHLDIPVATGESLSSKYQLAELLSFNEISILNIEPLHMGGILGSRKAADMIDAHYGRLIPHAAQGPICTVACLHIDASSPNAWLQETFEEFNAPWELSLITGFPAIKDGYFELPAGPGLGIDINLDEVARHPYDIHCEMNLFDDDWHLRKPLEPSPFEEPL